MEVNMPNASDVKIKVAAYHYDVTIDGQKYRYSREVDSPEVYLLYENGKEVPRGKFKKMGGV